MQSGVRSPVGALSSQRGLQRWLCRKGPCHAAGGLCLAALGGGEGGSAPRAGDRHRLRTVGQPTSFTGHLSDRGGPTPTRVWGARFTAPSPPAPLAQRNDYPASPGGRIPQHLVWALGEHRVCKRCGADGEGRRVEGARQDGVRCRGQEEEEARPLGRQHLVARVVRTGLAVWCLMCSRAGAHGRRSALRAALGGTGLKPEPGVGLERRGTIILHDPFRGPRNFSVPP